MSKQTNICVGCEIDAATATKLASKLDFACEIRKGNWTWKHESRCTFFTAPCELSVTRFRIAQAVLEGFKIGVFN